LLLPLRRRRACDAAVDEEEATEEETEEEENEDEDEEEVSPLYPLSRTLHFPAPKTEGACGLKTARPNSRPSASLQALGPSREDIFGACFS